MFAYDHKGHRLKKEIYDEKGKRCDFEYRYRYDGSGRLIEQACYDKEGHLLDSEDSIEIEDSAKTLYKYDSFGNPTETAIYDDNGNLKAKYLHECDADGDEVGFSLQYADGSTTDKFAYVYDEKGNVVEEVYHSAVDSQTNHQYTYSYDFDKMGNWTKQLWSERTTRFGRSYAEVQEATYRTITYY